MKFAQPIWLIAGLAAGALLLWRYRRFDRRQQLELARFASSGLLRQLTASVSAPRRRCKRALVVGGVLCLFAALARPQAGFRWEETHRRGLDLLFAVDTSKSMLAQDVKPNRLARAKMAVEDLLGKLDGDRAGLVAFAGNAFLQCPLTLDYDAFRQSLDALDTKVIPRGGTDIAAAIREAQAAFAGNGQNESILVLLTDGEDLEGNALTAARAAAQQGMKIFTVGVGSSSGELIPLTDESGGASFAKDASGQYVKSNLDERMLRQIAEATGAMYQPLGQQAQGLETIYQQGLARFTRRQLASRTQKVYLERFQWPLALGLFCLAIEPLLGIRRRQSRTELVPSPAASGLSTPWILRARPAVGVGSTALVLWLVLADSAQASPAVAEKAFQKGDYARAEKEYGQAAAKRPDQPVLEFNHGAAAYKTRQFDLAAESFARAMKTDDPALQRDNHYNLGNTQYRLGQKTEQSDVPGTIKTWEQALQSYEAALKLKPEDADAKYNRDFVKRKLDEFKKKQDQQQQQQQQEQQQQQNQQQDQKQKENQGKSEDKSEPQQDNQQNQQNSNPQEQPDKSGDKKEQPKPDDGAGTKNQPEQKNEKSTPSGQQPNPSKENEPDKPGKKQGQAGRPDQAKQPPEDKPAGGAPDQKPAPVKKDGQPQARNPQKHEAGQEEAEPPRGPGQMSREEARQLLDSLKAGDRKMPLEPGSRGNETARDDHPIKDW